MKFSYTIVISLLLFIIIVVAIEIQFVRVSEEFIFFNIFKPKPAPKPAPAPAFPIGNLFKFPKMHIYLNNPNLKPSGYVSSSKTTDITDWNKTQENFTVENFSQSRNLPIDISYWPELNDMMVTCKNYGYSVPNWTWGHHINLLANEIKIPIEVRNVNTTTWNVYRYFWKSEIINESTFIIQHSNYYNPYYTNGNTIDTKKQYRFAKYGDFISQLVKNAIRNDAKLKQVYNLNNEQFSTFETDGATTFDGNSYPGIHQQPSSESSEFFPFSPFSFLDDILSFFTQQKDTKEGLVQVPPNLQVKEVDKIKLENNKTVVNNNIIDAITRTGFQLSSEKLPAFVNDFLSNGKKINDITNYISALKKIGIEDETTTEYFKRCILSLNRNLNNLDLTTLINNFLPKYGLTSVTEFTKISSDGAFTHVIKNHNLHKITIKNNQDTIITKTNNVFNISNVSNRSNISSFLPLFTTDRNVDCVMEKMVSIHGINIPTIGKKGEDLYYIDLFFTEFKSYGVSANDFFNKFYNNYSIYKINESQFNLNIALSIYIAPLSENGFEDAFNNKLPEILTSIDMNFNEYISLILTMEKYGIFNKNEIADIWHGFVRYYTLFAYRDAPTQILDNLDNPVTVNTFIKWAKDIEDHYAQNSPFVRKQKNSPFVRTQPKFFSKEGGYLFTFVKNVLLDKEYTVASIKRDISLGMTYMKISSPYASREQFSLRDPENHRTPPSIRGFTVNTPDTEVGYFSKNVFMDAVRSILQYLFGSTYEEGYSPLNITDANALSQFGVTLSDDLSELERTLVKKGISTVDPRKQPWENIITFVYAMVQNRINNDNLNSFIKLMEEFGAKTPISWLDVLTKLAPYEIAGVKVEGFLDVTEFIGKITDFGVKYDYDDGSEPVLVFNLFINKLNDFEANFRLSGLDPFHTFLDDMDRIGLTYKTESERQRVNNIIDFFVSYKITIITYSSDSELDLSGCVSSTKSVLPPRLCTDLVNAMYNYKDDKYFHSYYDIQTPALFKIVQDCGDAINSMKHAYALCISDQETSIIIQQTNTIVPFFYKQEMTAIMSGSKTYDDITNRVKMMHNIANAMNTYANSFDLAKEGDKIILFKSIVNVLKMFPVVSFQYFANLFISCSGDNCSVYASYMDQTFTYSKANTDSQSVNMRTNDPVV